jgi:UDP-N-acetylmuramate dehydrogenase
MPSLIEHLPPVRGQMLYEQALAPFTWFRVGGPADAVFLPADLADLAAFLAATPLEVPVSVLGVGSNVIIRDGGMPGVVVRLVGKAWGQTRSMPEHRLEVHAGALDMRVAEAAAELGLTGLEFLTGIPGTIGGALQMNAGCYGREIADVLVEAHGLTRTGRAVQFSLADCGFSYRHSEFPPDVILTHAVLQAAADPEGPVAIRARMAEFRARREASQPIRDRTGGSTFANPDPPGTPDQRRAWALIEAAGLRGMRVGGAQVSEKHCNFLINAEEARAADIEALGELVRARVREMSGVELRWEIKRLGRC